MQPSNRFKKLASTSGFRSAATTFESIAKVAACAKQRTTADYATSAALDGPAVPLQSEAASHAMTTVAIVITTVAHIIMRLID